MSSTTPNDPAEYVPFKVFQRFGFFLGGLLPVAIFIVLYLFGSRDDLVEHNALGSIIVTAIVCLSIGSTISHYYEDNKNKLWFGILFLLQALFSFFLIHILVAYTGGSKHSVFAFSYLYIPTIVGFSYGNGKKLIGASVILGLSYLWNLTGLESAKYSFLWYINLCSNVTFNAKNENSFSLLFLHIAVFLIQLIMITYIASKQPPIMKPAS